jgi:hypothetical protein
MKEAGPRSKGVGETSGVYDKAVKGRKGGSETVVAVRV